MRIRTRQYLIVGAAAIALVLASCSTNGHQGAAPARPMSAAVDSDAQPHQEVHAYPLDRSLEGLLGFPAIDAVLLVSQPTVGDAVYLDSDAYDFSAVSTPVTAEVDRVLYGSIPTAVANDPSPAGLSVEFVIAGGEAEGQTTVASDELAPGASDMDRASQLVVAGEWRQTPEFGLILDPYFIYRIDGDMVTSLLVSGGADPGPSFSLRELVAGLDRRAAKN